MRTDELINGQIYHIFNHAVGDRDVFLRKPDYQRFLDNMCLFNDQRRKHRGGDDYQRRSEIGHVDFIERIPLVRVISFILMPNHFHMMLEQVADDGISKFLHKLSMGYAKYAIVNTNAEDTSLNQRSRPNL